jgi:hypothetical protein
MKDTVVDVETDMSHSALRQGFGERSLRHDQQILARALKFFALGFPQEGPIPCPAPRQDRQPILPCHLGCKRSSERTHLIRFHEIAVVPEGVLNKREE